MKRRLTTCATLFSLALIGCNQTAGIGEHKPTTLSAAQRSIVEAGLRAHLKDPNSAKFGEMRAGFGPNGAMRVCGWVNAKNSYGGYGGAQIFGAELVGNKLEDVVMDSPGDEFKAVADDLPKCRTHAAHDVGGGSHGPDDPDWSSRPDLCGVGDLSARSSATENVGVSAGSKKKLRRVMAQTERMLLASERPPFPFRCQSHEQKQQKCTK